MSIFSNHYRQQDKVKVVEKSQKDISIIQRNNRWADIMKVIIDRLLERFSKYPPSDYCWVRFWKGDGKKRSYYELLSWPIYYGSSSSYYGDTNGPSHLNLLENKQLSCVGYTAPDGENAYWEQRQPISLDHVHDTNTQFGFHRLVIFKAMTAKALEIGVITKTECDGWERELAGLDY